jgi:hypothetical protein
MTISCSYPTVFCYCKLQLQSHLLLPVSPYISKNVQRLPSREHWHQLAIMFALHFSHSGIPRGPHSDRMYIDPRRCHPGNRTRQIWKRRSYSISTQHKDVRKTVAIVECIGPYTSEVGTLDKLDYCRLSRLGRRRPPGHSCDTRDEQKACKECRQHGDLKLARCCLCARKIEYTPDRLVLGHSGHIYTMCASLLRPGLSSSWLTQDLSMVTLGRRCHANRDHHRGTSDTLSGRHEGCERRTALATLNRHEG